MKNPWLATCYAVTLFLIPFLDLQAAVLKVHGAKTLCTPLLEGAERIRKERGLGLMVNNQGGSEDGIKKVYFNKADLACVVRFLNEKEKRILMQETIAFDYLVAVVKKDLPIDNLSKEQIKQIFAGGKSKWHDLDVSFPDLPIEPILTRKKSGTNKNIQEFFLGKDTPFREDALFVNTMTSVPKLLSEMKGLGGISLMSKSLLAGYESTLKVIHLDTIAPTTDNVSSGVYPYGRPVTLVYKKNTKRLSVINMLIRYLQDPKVNFFSGELVLNTPAANDPSSDSVPK
ncbi:MAG: substrate-binding domain-containing protein [Magnetococcus sp. YQC-5]